MADPRRLGKRGAYRFGAQRITGSESGHGGPRPRGALAGGRAPRRLSFRTSRSRGAAWVWLAACAVTAVILGFGAALGLWFLPFIAGLAAGLAPWRARSALGLVVLAVAVAVAAGWGAALWWPALSGAPAGATARVIAALAGLPPYAAVGVAATLLVGILQTLAAFWLARAVISRPR